MERVARKSPAQGARKRGYIVGSQSEEDAILNANKPAVVEYLHKQQNRFVGVPHDRTGRRIPSEHEARRVSSVEDRGDGIYSIHGQRLAGSGKLGNWTGPYTGEDSIWWMPDQMERHRRRKKYRRGYERRSADSGIRTGKMVRAAGRQKRRA